MLALGTNFARYPHELALAVPWLAPQGVGGASSLVGSPPPFPRAEHAALARCRSPPPYRPIAAEGRQMHWLRGGTAWFAAECKVRYGITERASAVVDIFEALAPMRVARLLEGAVLAIVRFDLRAAFPGVSWEWICLVLRRLSVLEWLVVAVQSLYSGSHSDIVFGGTVSERGFPTRRGILHGVPRLRVLVGVVV